MVKKSCPKWPFFDFFRKSAKIAIFNMIFSPFRPKSNVFSNLEAFSEPTFDDLPGFFADFGPSFEQPFFFEKIFFFKKKFFFQNNFWVAQIRAQS